MVVYQAGDIICEALPYVHVLKYEHKGLRCDYCFKLSKSLKKCGKCKEMFYCSRSCQVKDWKSGHKFKECELFARQKMPAANAIISKGPCLDLINILVRLALKVKLDPSAHDKMTLYDGEEHEVMDMMDHFEEFLANEDMYEKQVLPITNYVACVIENVDVHCDEFEMLRLYGKLNVNKNAIGEYFPKPIELGIGLYQTYAYFDHSCVPTTVASEGVNLVIRAAKAMDTDLERPTIAYVDPFLPREDRQRVLKDLWFFDCKCGRCEATAGGDKFDYVKYHMLNGKSFTNELANYKNHEKLMTMESTVFQGTYSVAVMSRLFFCVLYAQSMKLPEFDSYLDEFFAISSICLGQEKADYLRDYIVTKKFYRP